MLETLRKNPWLPAVPFVFGVVALYAGAIGTGFLNDDYLFLEDAARGPWAIAHGALANYFRPLSRQVWFGLLTPATGGNALAFHLASLALFLAAAWLLYDLLRAFAPRHAALAGLVYFAVLPLQRVNLTWISCCQDLLALLSALGAFALFRRGRDRLAWLAFLAAVLAKESALPLPALLFLWTWRIEGRPAHAAVRRVAPFALPVAAWALGEAALRASAPAAATLRFAPAGYAAALAHGVQSLLGLENPTGLVAGFRGAVPSVAALAGFGALALWFPAPGGGHEGEPRAGHAAAFGLAWIAAFAVPVWPVAAGWSAYFYTLTAVGAAVLVAAAAARASRWAFAGALAVGLWWHAAVSAAPAFAVADDAWTWTSHLTAHYFERGAALSARLRAALHRIEPAPAHGTRFFFATLPSYAGFQMGNGALIRHTYSDPTLESSFYSNFSDTTADRHPCVFLFWNGRDFERLSDQSNDPFFQVGTDLLMLDRYAGAAFAFQRALDAGGLPQDNLYWSGWALLWDGHRDRAEAAWRAFGAADDSLAYARAMREAATALLARDSTAARRDLYQALRAGIGRPEVHAALVELLRPRSAKFALLETKVTARLAPGDPDARLALVRGLVDVGLDERAAHELADARRRWPADTVFARLDATLKDRRPGAHGVEIVPTPK